MSNFTSLYENEHIALSSMHKKELFIGPFCQKILKASLVSLEGRINTDLLGTFSGEVERKGAQRQVLREKCFQGMQLTNLPFGIASEGSFGPHPALCFLPCAHEMLVFIDKVRNIEICESRSFLETNFGHTTSKEGDDIEDFLRQAKFPSHGLIVRPHIWEDKICIVKGIQDYETLKRAINLACRNSSDGTAHIETDMRAHMNPTRGRTLKKLSVLLFRKLCRLCPSCKMPGWGKTCAVRGLPCAECFSETTSLRADLWSCVQCGYQEEKERAPGELADPRYCEFCNP